MSGPYGNFVGLNNQAGNIGQSTGIAGSNPNYNPRQQGLFALNPLSSPKYARNKGLRDAEFRDTIARIYVSLADAQPGTQQAYLNSVPQDARALAQVLLGSNNQGTSGFVDFLLAQAVETTQEVVQVEKVVGDDYVAFFFGQQPPIFQYSGFLINSQQDDQRMSFARAYQEILRGTRLAQRSALARLRYDSVIVSGTMTAHQQTLNADNELAVPFSFSFLVKEYVIVPEPLFTRTSVDDFVKLATDQAVNNLGGVGAPSDVRVRTTMVLPPSLASSSSAGQDQGNINNPILSPLINLINQAATSTAALTTTNIRGVVGGSNTTPPPPNAPNL